MLRLMRDLPLAVRFDAYIQAQSRARNGRVVTDLQTPWLIKLLSGGEIAHDISYYFYFFLAERGEVAGLEDAYLQFTDLAGSGVSVIAGQFQVSDPLFKRELRLEFEDYQPYRFRVGDAIADLTYDRGFMAFFSPREGMDVSLQAGQRRRLEGRRGTAAVRHRQSENGSRAHLPRRRFSPAGGICLRRPRGALRCS